MLRLIPSPALRFARSFVILSALLATAGAQEFFTYDKAAVGNGFVQAPVLDNDNAAEVATILFANQIANLPTAIRVREALNTTQALAVLQDFPLAWVFNDFNGTDRVAITASTARQVLGFPQSRKGYVGDFNLFGNAESDDTHPVSLAGSQTARFSVLSGPKDFKLSRGKLGKRLSRQISMPVLFPGAPDFRNPAQGNSGAPNIRSALFTLPIQRLTFAALGLRGLKNPAKNKPAFYTLPVLPAVIDLLPVVARFNNYGNAALGGGPSGNGFVQNAATPSNGQLLSRGDYQALILHYRFRGANGGVLFSGDNNVVGYSAAQHRSDINTGWSASSVANDIFTRGKYSFANLTNLIGDSGEETGDTSPRSTELAGAVWSGVFDRKGADRHLVILLSNLSAVQKTIDFPKIGGKRLLIDAAPADPDNVTINAGAHRLLNFHLEGKNWVFDNDSFIGLDNNRNGVGVGAENPPEN